MTLLFIKSIPITETLILAWKFINQVISKDIMKMNAFPIKHVIIERLPTKLTALIYTSITISNYSKLVFFSSYHLVEKCSGVFYLNSHFYLTVDWINLSSVRRSITVPLFKLKCLEQESEDCGFIRFSYLLA